MNTLRVYYYKNDEKSNIYDYYGMLLNRSFFILGFEKNELFHAWLVSCLCFKNGILRLSHVYINLSGACVKLTVGKILEWRRYMWLIVLLFHLYSWSNWGWKTWNIRCNPNYGVIAVQTQFWWTDNLSEKFLSVKLNNWKLLNFVNLSRTYNIAFVTIHASTRLQSWSAS